MVATPPAHVIRLDFAIGPVALRMSPSAVHAALGTPTSIRKGKSRPGWISRTETFARRGLTIQFLQGGGPLSAYTITTTSPLDRTGRGVGVRSTEAQVRRRVPGVRCGVDRHLGRYCRRPREGGVGGTLFVLREGRVTSVEVFSPVF